MDLSPFLLRARGLALVLLATACVCTREGGDKPHQPDANHDAKPSSSPAASFHLDEGLARQDLTELTQEPHPFGSERQAELTHWLLRRIGEAGATSVAQTFTSEVPNPAALTDSGPVVTTLTKTGTNVWALQGTDKNAPCVVALASHYDTKDIPGLRYVGANDSGSSSVTLLQQVAWLKQRAAQLNLVCDIVAVWFDGEEPLLPNWNDGLSIHPAKLQDNTYGSRYAASQLASCTFADQAARCLPAELGGKPLIAVILMDMIGSPGLRLSRDSHSTPSLVALAAEAAKVLGHPGAYDTRETAVADDHIPFLQAGVPAIDLIDFNNLDYWHQAGDEAGAISPQSLELAGRIALHVAIAVARAPGSYL